MASIADYWTATKEVWREKSFAAFDTAMQDITFAKTVGYGPAEARENAQKWAADYRANSLQSTTLREHIADRVYEAMPERVQAQLDDRAIRKLVVQQDIAAAQSAVKSATQPARERAWAAADAQASLDLSPRQTQSARAAVRLGG